MPEAVDECVKSVLDDNPDMDESRAFAICNAKANKGQLADAAAILAAMNDPDHDLQAPDVFPFEDVDACELRVDEHGIDDPREYCEALFEGADPDASLQTLVHDLADVQTPGDISRSEDGDGVRYENVLLLAPGVWGDAGSGRRVFYSPEGIENSADNWADDTINLFHEQDNEVVEVGSVDTDSVFVDDDGNLYGDLVLSMDNDASRMADDLLMQALETGGRKGIQGPSVELRGERYDDSQHPPELLEGTFNGLGLVGLGVSPGPGSKDAAFAKQTRNRAVALASSDDAVLLTRDYAPMTDNTLLSRLAEELSDDDLRELAEEHGIDLQDGGEMAMVQDLIEQATNEGFDLGDQSADELRTFIEENLDPSEDAMAAFDDIADAYLEAEEAESLDVTPAEGMLDFIVEQMEGDEPEDPEDGGEEPPEGDMEEMQSALADLRESITDIDDRLTTLADETEPFREAETTLSDLNERLESVPGQDTVEELEQRLSDLEETLAEPTSLAARGGVDPTDEDAEEIVLSEMRDTTPDSEGSFPVNP